MAKKNITLKKGRTQQDWDELIGDGIITRPKQPEEEIALIKARHEHNNSWVRLEQAITNYNLYVQNKLTNKNK